MSLDKKEFLLQKKARRLPERLPKLFDEGNFIETDAGMLMLGNLFRESGVVARLEDIAKNALINIIIIFLGITVGANSYSRTVLKG